jgi:hypothetical protein
MSDNKKEPVADSNLFNRLVRAMAAKPLGKAKASGTALTGSRFCPYCPCGQMGEPQEAQPEPHEKSESPEHHLFKKAETVRFFMAQAHRAAASREP